MQKLNLNDYIDILKYYKQPIPKINKEGRKTLRREAEKILAENLCRRIKSSDKENKKHESTSINIY